METISFQLSKNLKSAIEKHSDINWTALIEDVIKQKLKDIEDLEFIKDFTADSTMTEEESIQLGRELNLKVAKRFGVV